jgi:hypothetical protein
METIEMKNKNKNFSSLQKAFPKIRKNKCIYIICIKTHTHRCLENVSLFLIKYKIHFLTQISKLINSKFEF